MRHLARFLTDCAIRNTSISIRGNHDTWQRRTKLIIFTDVREGYRTSGNYSKGFKKCMFTAAFFVRVSAFWVRSFSFSFLVHIRWVKNASINKSLLAGNIDVLKISMVNPNSESLRRPDMSSFLILRLGGGYEDGEATCHNVRMTQS